MAVEIETPVQRWFNLPQDDAALFQVVDVPVQDYATPLSVDVGVSSERQEHTLESEAGRRFDDEDKARVEPAAG